MGWEFEKISYIYLLLLLPVLIWRVFYLIKWKRERVNLFTDSTLRKRIFPTDNPKKFLQNNILIILTFISIVFGLVNFLSGIEKKEVKREGIDMVFVIDVSNSMNAQDVAPSRIEKAKKIISNIINKLGGDRVGIVVFAGRAYSVMPLSNDYGAAELYLQGVDTNLITAQGTNIASAVSEASNMLSGSSTSKAIILISDGEAHEGNVGNAIEIAESKYITIFSIGIGTFRGAPIPVISENGNSEYKKDKDGNVVLTKLEDNSLKKVASKTDGKYIYAENDMETSLNMLEALSNLKKKEQSSSFTYDSKQYFQIFIGIALILLIIISLTDYKKDFNI